MQKIDKISSALIRSGALLTIILVILMGCSTVQRGGGYPSPSPGFVPKQTHAVPVEKAWNAVLLALNKNQIVVASSSKDSGQILTNYKAAEQTNMGGGLFGAWVYQYRFTIFLRSETATTTNIRIDATIIKQLGSQSPLGLNLEMPDTVKSLENWLYEQIDKSI